MIKNNKLKKSLFVGYFLGYFVTIMGLIFLLPNNLNAHNFAIEFIPKLIINLAYPLFAFLPMGVAAVPNFIGFITFVIATVIIYSLLNGNNKK